MKVVFTSLIIAFVAACATFGYGVSPTKLAHGIYLPYGGNYTVVDVPVSAMMIGPSQIPIGRTWTYSYQLVANHTYHIYLVGDWASSATHNTDYDIYVYDPNYQFFSSHTEAAGLPEQVGNDGFMRYFTPSRSGEYTFCVRNDPDSKAAENGTLMVIEHIDTNQWYSLNMQGKVCETPMRETNWAYEFNTTAKRIRVFVDVPNTLDMYEARLYLMATPSSGKGAMLNGVPVAWEPGLRGKTSGYVGGFNLDPEGFRPPNAMASCEHNGEDMIIDFDVPADDNVLYHLALMAEYGSGSVKFVVQTDFEPPSLRVIDPPTFVNSENITELRLSAQDDVGMKSVSMSYRLNDDGTWWQLPLTFDSNGIYSVEIPGQSGGTDVDYVFDAVDVMENRAQANGSFRVLNPSSLEVKMDYSEIKGGDSVSTYGYLSQGDKTIEIIYTKEDEIHGFNVTTDALGYYQHRFMPPSAGVWQVSASYSGDDTYTPAESETLSFRVTKKPMAVTCSLGQAQIKLGEDTTVSGEVSPKVGGLPVEIRMTDGSNATQISVVTDVNGQYSAAFKPTSANVWDVYARVVSDGLHYEDASSGMVEMKVSEFTIPERIYNFSMFLLSPPYVYGIVGTVGLIVAVSLIKRRGQRSGPDLKLKK
jgi:hypothetical protein